MSITQNTPTDQEIISTLLDVKKYQPLKTGSASPADYVRILWFAHREGIVKNTDLGYEIAQKGQRFLDSKLPYDTWVKDENKATTRADEKVKAAKEARKNLVRLIFYGTLLYLILHYWLKVF